jgi:hypothetical protein
MTEVASGQRFWKILGTVLGIAALLFFMWFGYLSDDYGQTRPRVADQSTERVYPFDWKGRIVYLTKSEQFNFYFAQAMSLILFVGTGCIYNFVLKRK